MVGGLEAPPLAAAWQSACRSHPEICLAPSRVMSNCLNITWRNPTSIMAYHGLVDGKIYRKHPYLMVKSLSSYMLKQGGRSLKGMSRQALSPFGQPCFQKLQHQLLISRLAPLARQSDHLSWKKTCQAHHATDILANQCSSTTCHALLKGNRLNQAKSGRKSMSQLSQRSFQSQTFILNHWNNLYIYEYS